MMKTSKTLYLGATLAILVLGGLVAAGPAWADGDRARCEAEIDFDTVTAVGAASDGECKFRWRSKGTQVRSEIECNTPEGDKLENVGGVTVAVLGDNSVTASDVDGGNASETCPEFVNVVADNIDECDADTRGTSTLHTDPTGNNFQFTFVTPGGAMKVLGAAMCKDPDADES